MGILNQLFKKKPPKSPFMEKVEANRKKHRELKARWDDARTSANQEVIGLQEIHVSNEGNIYYIHTNILQLVYVRYTYMVELIQAIQFGFTPSEFNSMIDKITQATDLQTAKNLAADAKQRFNRFPHKDSLLALAMCLIYRHDENPYNKNAVLAAQKMQEAKSDPDLEVFFLKEAWVTAKKVLEEKSGDFKGLSFHDFLSHLMNQAKSGDFG